MKGSDKIRVKGSRRIVNYKYMYVDTFQQTDVAEGSIEVKKKCRDIRKFLTEKMEKEYGKGVILDMDVMRIDNVFDVPYELLKKYEVKEKEN